MSVNDLEKIKREWLNPCGPCDFGLVEFGCTCPDEDVRPVMLALVTELERLRATNGCPSCAAGGCDEVIHLSSAHIGELAQRVVALEREVKEEDGRRLEGLRPGGASRWSGHRGGHEHAVQPARGEGGAVHADTGCSECGTGV